MKEEDDIAIDGLLLVMAEEDEISPDRVLADIETRVRLDSFYKALKLITVTAAGLALIFYLISLKDKVEVEKQELTLNKSWTVMPKSNIDITSGDSVTFSSGEITVSGIKPDKSLMIKTPVCLLEAIDGKMIVKHNELTHIRVITGTARVTHNGDLYMIYSGEEAEITKELYQKIQKRIKTK